ncbi:MAG: ABC transporter permease [Candidatus Hydrogenedentes bacterium]|nr:ABC transporter permease [Candidatus Hydrogenedentota bacterium]
MKRVLGKLGGLAPLITCLAMLLFFSLITDTFLTSENLLNILRQNSALAIMAVGVTFILLLGEIDLSIENMAIFAGVLTAFLYKMLMDMPGLSPLVQQGLPILAAIAASAAFGLVNGLGVSRLGVPSFMMTLAMFLIAKGFALKVTRGSPIFDVPPVLGYIGTKSIPLLRGPEGAEATRPLLEVPLITVAAVVCLLLALIVLRYTRFGRNVYAVGGNRNAAELSGVNVRRTLAVCFCLCSITAACSGIILIGRLGSAQAGGLDNMLIACISAVVLGGTSLFGGKGGIANTIIGVLTFGILYNGLNHVQIDIYLKETITGAILLAALVLNVTMAKVRTG